MQKARVQGFSAHAAAGHRLALQHQNLAAFQRQQAGRDQPVDAGPDDDVIEPP